MRVVLDTNVLVSALGWAGNERAVLLETLSDDIDLLLSDFIISEFLEVTSRDKFADIPLEKIALFIEIMLETLVIVETKTNIRIIKGDPADNRILECAIDGKADYIVSGDRHLLDLRKHEGVNILKPKEFLKLFK